MTAVLAEWGLAGLEALRERVAVLIIVDVLSFSTAVDIAVSRGAVVFPFPLGDRAAAQAAADCIGATLAQPRQAAGGQFSLSPGSLQSASAGTKLMLPSPNGSRLSLAGGPTPVMTGCLRNAAAVARAARILAADGAVGVIPAGERWPDGSLRPAIEDLLGAGAIVDHLAGSCSPEAQVARDAFRTAGSDVARLVRQSVSGRELTDWGFAGDVELAVAMDASACAPRLVDGAYRAG
jgi:2-phosphosulfolactate phosphatase